MIVSASALVRNCGHVRQLKRARRPTPDQQRAMDRGTAFHGAVEALARDRYVPAVADLEMQGWLDLLAATWCPVGAETEIAWGLTHFGEHTTVEETKPHVYEAAPGVQLLTAGRCDVAWLDSSGVLHVADWKTGKWPAPPAAENLQVNAAGIALAQRFGAASAYVPAIYYARDGYWDVGPKVTLGTPDHMRIFGEVKTAALLDETPRPGPWCTGCWERKNCKSAAA